jgi:hypothetical protein
MLPSTILLPLSPSALVEPRVPPLERPVPQEMPLETVALKVNKVKMGKPNLLDRLMGPRGIYRVKVEQEVPAMVKEEQVVHRVNQDNLAKIVKQVNQVSLLRKKWKPSPK